MLLAEGGVNPRSHGYGRVRTRVVVLCLGAPIALYDRNNDITNGVTDDGTTHKPPGVVGLTDTTNTDAIAV